MDLTTIPRVPICRTGHYELASGSVDFTAEHFAAAVTAFENDPAILAPRIRVQLEDQAHLDHEGITVEASGGQGGPALGWADGLATDGVTLYADLHLPTEVADVMEWAFPARSIEGLFGWTTATGHTHDFVATGLLLLGTDWPGVTTLPDFRELESEFATEVLAAGAADTPVMVIPPREAAVAARVGATPRSGQPMGDRIAQAGLSVFDLRARWYGAEEAGELVDLPGSYDFWTWYVSEVRADDDGTLYVVVYDESSGDQWRFDVTAIDGTNVTFGTPQPGALDWRGATAAAMSTAAEWARTPRPALARWRTRGESRSAFASAPTPTPPQEDDRPMNDALRRTLATRHGLDPETATEDQVEAAVMAAETPPPETPPEGEPDPPEGDQPAEDNERVAVVDRAQFEDLQVAAARGVAADEARLRVERDQFINACLNEGRISPASAGMTRNADGSLPDGWRADLDRDPEGTARALARLEPGKYPGAARATGTTTTNRQGQMARARASFPELRKTAGVS
jgi:hypothetical protein